MIKKFNPIQLLAEISSSQGSGCLNASNDSASWNIYVQDGDLKYVECSVEALAQLNHHLCRLGFNQAYEALKKMPESGEQPNIITWGLTWLLNSQHLSTEQAVQILQAITQDNLESFLWLTEGASSWLEQKELPQWVKEIAGNEINLNLEELVKTSQKRLRYWQEFVTDIHSPYARPYLFDSRDITQSAPAGTLSQEDFTKLAKLLRGFSIRQLALLLKQDELSVAKLLLPYIKNKAIFLRDPKAPFDQLPRVPKLNLVRPKPAQQQATQTYKIICIDDSPTILSEMQRFLVDDRFQVTAVDDPIKASAIIFRVKPDLILLDISMPKINGYKLCGLLRSSSMFDSTPIIMVTGNTGFLDKARAKLAGATDYLTKPFTREGLNSIVYKYLEVN